MARSEISSRTGVIGIKTGTAVQIDDDPSDDSYVGNIKYLKQIFAKITGLPSKIGQVLRNGAGNEYSPTFPKEFIEEFFARDAVDVGDVVSYYPTTDTIQKNGRRFKAYPSVIAATTVAASNNARPFLLKIDATHLVLLFSGDTNDSDTTFNGIYGIYYTIEDDRTFTPGPTVTIAASGSTNAAPFHACVLDGTHFVVAWRIAASTATDAIVAVRCTISGGTFTVGAQQKKNSQTSTAASEAVRVRALTSTSFLLLEMFVSGSSTRLSVVSAPSDTFTFNAEADFPGTFGTPHLHASDIEVVSSTSAIAVLVDGTNVLVFQVTISGTSVAIVQTNNNTSVGFVPAINNRYRSMTMRLSEDKRIATCYFRHTSSTSGISIAHFYTQTAVPSNDDVLSAAEVVAGIENFPSDSDALGADTLYLPTAYGDFMETSNDGIVVFGTPVIEGQAVPQYFLASLLVRHASEATTPSVRLGQLGSTATPMPHRNTVIQDANDFDTAYQQAALCKMDNSTFVGAFLSDDGTDAVLNLVAIEKHRVLGFCLDAGVADDLVRVQFAGVCDVFSSLEIGQDCFSSDDGDVSLAPRNYKMGTAISATKMLMDVREA